jgi:hypothetical protein
VALAVTSNSRSEFPSTQWRENWPPGRANVLIGVIQL